MTIFAIMTPPLNPKLALFDAALERVFGNAHRRVAPGQYLAAKPQATSSEIYEALGAAGEVGQFMVITNGGWSGWHQKDHWEWLRAHGA